MSDADWDMEYDKAWSLKQEIIKLCEDKGIECPDLSTLNRSWELQPILKQLKDISHKQENV